MQNNKAYLFGHQVQPNAIKFQLVVPLLKEGKTQVYRVLEGTIMGDGEIKEHYMKKVRGEEKLMKTEIDLPVMMIKKITSVYHGHLESF